MLNLATDRSLPFVLARAASLCPRISIENLERRIRYGSYVNLERRYLYYQVSKAGCTSLKWLIHNLEGMSPVRPFASPQREARRDMFIHERSNISLPSLLDLSDEDQERVISSEDFFRFALVRNPYTRIESAWKDKIRLCAPGYEQVYLQHRGALPSAAEPGSIISFREFLGIVSHEDVENCDAHWRLQSAQLLRGALNLSFVGKLERYSEAVERFCRHFGVAAPTSSVGMNRSSGASNFDEETASLVYALYREDFDTFGYEKDSWTHGGTGAAVVPEAVLVAEVLERNVVINELYAVRDEMRSRINGLEAALRAERQRLS